MRLIYLLALDADAAAAAEVEALLKQRGYQVRRADEKFAFPPARAQEITLALWSKAVQLSARHIFFTNRAIDAWTEGRLIFARLDHCLPPRGLGDMETIDLSFAPARLAAVWKIVEAAQEIDKALDARRREAAAAPEGREGLAPPAPEPGSAGLPAKSKHRPGGSEFSSGAALVVGLVAAAACGSLGYLTMPAAPAVLLGGAAIAWGGVAGALGGFLGGRPKIVAPEPDLAAAAPAPPASKSAAADAAGEDDLLADTPPRRCSSLMRAATARSSIPSSPRSNRRDGMSGSTATSLRQAPTGPG